MSGLEKVLFPVEFSGGVDTKTDPKRVVPGKLLLLQNGTFTKGKKITKRNGYDGLGVTVLGGPSLSSSQGLCLYANELLQVSLNTLYSYSEGLDSWVSKGALYSVRNSNTPIVRNGYKQSTVDLAISNGVAFYAYEETPPGGTVTVKYTAVDNASGTVLSQGQVATTGTNSNPRVLSVGNVILLLYANLNAGVTSIYVKVFNPFSPNTIGADTSVQADLNTNHYFGAVSTGTYGIIAYCQTAGTSIKVLYINQDGSVGSPTSGLPSPVTIAQSVDNCIGVTYESQNGRTGVFYSNNTSGLCFTALNQDFSVYQANYQIDSDVTTPAIRVAPYTSSTTQFGVLYEKATASGNAWDHLVRARTLNILGGGGISSTVIRSAGLASKAFQYGTDWFAIVAHESTLQSTFFLMRSDGQVFSKMLPDQAGGLPAKNVLPGVTVSGSSAYYPAQIQTKLVSQGNTTFTIKGLSLETIDFAPTSSFLGREIAGNLLIAGGMVMSYDGATLSEHGFNFFPENVTTATSNSTGTIANGTYEYFVVYEWTDNQGQVHRSAPSVGISVVVSGANNTVTLTVPTLRITGKSNVVISVYRTQASGTTAYKVFDTSATGNIRFNSTSSDTVSFVDGTPDASILANEILYTTGAVLDNDSLPSASIVEVNKNRAILLGLEDPLTFWYSKQAVASEGLGFSGFLNYRVDPTGGALTAGKFMDDKIILFKNSYIFYVSGDGPDNTGSNNTFTDPVLVTSDVGCVNPKSVVLTPMGLMFQSSKGIYLLTRALQTQYIGADVEGYNSQTITSATLIEDKNQVRFLVSSGETLVYDYYFNQWSTFTNHVGVGAGLWQGSTYVYARSNGQVYKEDAANPLDVSLSFSMVAKTGWLKLSGLQGFQRVRSAFLLGDYLSAHKLRVQIAYDYEPYFYESHLIDATTVVGPNAFGSGATYGSDSTYGGVASGVYQFQVDTNRQKCEAVQLQFDDVGAAGAAYSLSDLTLEMGMKSGGFKLPFAKRVQ